MKIYIRLLFVIFIVLLPVISVSADITHQPLYTNPSTTNLVSCWSLDEISGTRNDSYGTNHLTDNNTVTAITGKVGNASQFVIANSENLSIADNASLSMGNIDFSFVGWYYLSSNSVNQYFFAKGDNTQLTREYNLIYSQSTNRFQFRVGNGSSSGVVDANSLGVPTLNTWYFIFAYYDSVADVVGIQVNNGVVDTVSYAGGSYDSAFSFRVGSNSVPAFFLTGLVDELILYKRVLNTVERTWLYNSGNGRSCVDILSTPTPTVTNTFTPTNTNTPVFTSTFTNTPTKTNTPVFTSTFTNTPTKTNTPVFTFTSTFTPTYTFTPPATFTFTPSPTIVPTITNTPTLTGFPTEIGLPYFLLLVLPLLFIDWQVAIIWAFASITPAVSDFLQTLPFEGLEVWFLFFVVGFLRLIFFRNK